ncbi:hypothetical protein J7355_15695 [Endozoicomonas sp. G2_2]|uniref:hypothetical protein n=1 Tax=Endozoicomonas sp. G2_2 TaxID=2821092 RepID=UPI001ADD0D03|nr:hypothetical protein [Endozoicomonas sp. G2_2]MBO9471533.1 hypothetical protein [Endozoicomonas sp. G2_2]
MEEQHTPQSDGQQCPFCKSSINPDANTCVSCGAYEHIGLVRGEGIPFLFVMGVMFAGLFAIFTDYSGSPLEWHEVIGFRLGGAAAVAGAIWVMRRFMTHRRWLRHV